VNLVIRRAATPEEIDAAGALTAEAYRTDRLVDPEDSYLDELVDARRRASEAILLVALVPREPAAGGAGREADVVVGSITLAPFGTSYAEIAAPGELELRMLAVAPEARGRGIAEALMRAAVRESVLLGWDEVVLSTMDAMVAAQRLYVRLGWTRVPERDWGHVEIHLRVYTWRAPRGPGAPVERATWPPVLVEEVEGFEVGLSSGVTRRANCAVLAAGSWETIDADELARRLAAVEAAFGLAGLAPCVRVDGPVPAPGVPARTTTADRLLAARGYRDLSATFVMVRALGERIPEAAVREGVRIEAAAEPGESWLDVWLGGRSSADEGEGDAERHDEWLAERHAAQEVMTGVPARYLSAIVEERVVGVIQVCTLAGGATTRGTGDGGGGAGEAPHAGDDGTWAGLSCLAVLPEHRGRGIARLLTVHGLEVARSAGAARVFSQVLVRNDTAIALHERLGFEVAEVYRYAERAAGDAEGATRGFEGGSRDDEMALTEEAAS